jgi:CDP-glycerol glycerophosphotransferase (TagB/SpsB family)
MSVKFISSASPQYLASADVLIGDMSDINYEFLLFNRPVVLLANQWLKENFPDIGIKTDHKGLLASVGRSLDNPAEFEPNRKKWLDKTFNFPKDKSASKHILDIAVERSGYKSPKIILLHGGNITRESNIRPIFMEGKELGMDIHIMNRIDSMIKEKEVIYIAAHFDDLHIENGYKVHLDHGLKGKGTANIEISMADYKKHNYFPTINLHITAGPAGYERTTNLLLGPNKERAIIGAYPKADSLKQFKSPEFRNEVCKELGFDPKKKVIVYAPAGQLSLSKPGGSLSFKSIFYIYKLSSRKKVNVIVKLKNNKHRIIFSPIKNLYNIFRRVMSHKINNSSKNRS